MFALGSYRRGGKNIWGTALKVCYKPSQQDNVWYKEVALCILRSKTKVMFITHCACPSVLVRDPVCTWPVWHVSTDTRKHGSLGKAWIWKRLLSNQLWPGGETGPGIQTCSCIAHTRAGGGQTVRRESPLILWMSQTVMSNWVELI